jgi:hypothetical protein
MTCPQDPETGLAPGLDQPPQVRFLTARANPLRAAQTQGPHSGLPPSTPRDQPESGTVSPVNPARDNPLPKPRTDSPATATAPNPPGPNAQETHHDSLADPPTDTVTAPLTAKPPKPWSRPRQSRPAAYDHRPAPGPGRTPRRAQRGRSQQTKKLRVELPPQPPQLTPDAALALLRVLLTVHTARAHQKEHRPPDRPPLALCDRPRRERDN